MNAGKATAVGPSNIAFVKYWGVVDWDSVLPASQSLSMTLSDCVTRTTVELLEDGRPDEFWWSTASAGLAPASPEIADGISKQVQRVRELAGVTQPVRVATANTFPTGVGIASSASGYAALTVAATHAFGYLCDPDGLSRLARRSGSGSAARSTLGGYVLWPGTASDPGSAARQIAPASHWKLRNVIAVVGSEPKLVSSREGHRLAWTSPYFQRRLQLIPERIEGVRQAIAMRDFAALTLAVEQEAIDLHLIAMSAEPSVLYWRPATLSVIEAVRKLRRDGVEACATIDAGPNVHVLCEPAGESQVIQALEKVPGVQELISDGVGNGPYLTSDHLC